MQNVRSWCDQRYVHTHTHICNIYNMDIFIYFEVYFCWRIFSASDIVISFVLSFFYYYYFFAFFVYVFCFFLAVVFGKSVLTTLVDFSCLVKSRHVNKKGLRVF